VSDQDTSILLDAISSQPGVHTLGKASIPIRYTRLDRRLDRLEALERPSGAPHAEFQRQAVEAFQGIRGELDTHHDRLEHHERVLAMLGDDLIARSMPWRIRVREWFRRNVYDWRPV
jgi:hypothetical protein